MVFIAWAKAWDPNKALTMGEWIICEGGRLERYTDGGYILLSKIGGERSDSRGTVSGHLEGRTGTRVMAWK